MIGSFRAELNKLGRWPAFWALLVVWAALALTFGYVAPFITYTNPAAGVSDVARQATLAGLLPAVFPDKALPGYPLFGGVIALALGALVMGSEYGWGTWTTIFLQEPRRVSVMVGKLGALFIAALAEVIVGFTVAGVASVAVALSQGAVISAPPAADLISDLAAGWLMLMAWAALGALLALALRGTALPIGIGFALLLVNQLIASLADRSDVLADIARALLGTDAGALASGVLPAGFGAGTPGLNTLLSGAAAAAILAVYVLGAAGLSCLLVARRDVR